MVSRCKEHHQHWHKICLIQRNRIKKREKMHFTNCLSNGLLNPPFGNISTIVSLSENQTKNRCWDQNGRPDQGQMKVRVDTFYLPSLPVREKWLLQHRPFCTWLQIWTIEKKYNCIKNMKETNMAVTVLHDQKSSISGAPLTDLEQKRFWTRSGRLQKARWSKWRASSMPLSYLWFQFFRYNCFSINGSKGRQGLSRAFVDVL